MWKKISLGILTALFFSLTIGAIGWIGFQERIRLALKSLQHEMISSSPPETGTDQEAVSTQEADHAVVETKTEAEQVIDHLEGLLRSLEDDNVPTE